MRRFLLLNVLSQIPLLRVYCLVFCLQLHKDDYAPEGSAVRPIAPGAFLMPCSLCTAASGRRCPPSSSLRHARTRPEYAKGVKYFEDQPVSGASMADLDLSVVQQY